MPALLALIFSNLPALIASTPTLIEEFETILHAIGKGEGGPTKVANAATAVGALLGTVASVASQYPIQPSQPSNN